MMEGTRVIAVVPARGGSKSVARKNIRSLGGKPLLGWSVETARALPEIDRVIVSTDDAEIAATARRFGAETYARPSALATDEALVVDAIRHLYATLREEGEPADVMVLLEPTCPLRSDLEVRQCIRRLITENLDSVATFEAAEQHPHRTWNIVNGRPSPFIAGIDAWQPRQKLPPAYRLSGAVYAFRPGRLPADTTALLFGNTGAVMTPLAHDDHRRVSGGPLREDSSLRAFLVSPRSSLRDAMRQLEATEERTLFVVAHDGKLVGSITDGDIRRRILASGSLEGVVEDFCNRHPVAATPEFRMQDVRREMLERNIACIPVTDSAGRVVDLLFWGQVFQAPRIDIDTEHDLVIAETLLARGVFPPDDR